MKSKFVSVQTEEPTDM